MARLGVVSPPYKEGDSDDTFMPDQAHFHRRAVEHRIDQGHHRGGREIQVRQGAVRFVEHVPEFKRHRVQLRQEARHLLERESASNRLSWGCGGVVDEDIDAPSSCTAALHPPPLRAQAERWLPRLPDQQGRQRV